MFTKTLLVLLISLNATIGMFAQDLPFEEDDLIYSIGITPVRASTDDQIKTPKRLQTGFKLQGTQGIITALHGVADAIKISAYNRRNGYDNLIINDVDVGADVALLTSQELKNEDPIGLKPSIEPLVPEHRVTVIGHPNGVAILYKRHLNLIGDPPTVLLVIS